MQADDFYNILCFLVLFCQLPGRNSLTPLQDSMGKTIYIFRRDRVPRILQQPVRPLLPAPAILQSVWVFWAGQEVLETLCQNTPADTFGTAM